MSGPAWGSPPLAAAPIRMPSAACHSINKAMDPCMSGIVATDDSRIAEAVEAHGYDVMMTRRDHATGTDRLAEVVARRKLAQRSIRM